MESLYRVRYNNTDEIPTATDQIYRAMTQVPALSQLDKGMKGTQSLCANTTVKYVGRNDIHDRTDTLSNKTPY